MTNYCARTLMVLFLFFAVAGFCREAQATTINVGYMAIDQFIEPGPGPGVNSLTIANLTGNSALYPDFMVTSHLIFKDVLIQFYIGETILKTFSPSLINDEFKALFPDNIFYTSASFSATLSDTSFLLADGTTFSASSPLVMATLFPTQSEFLSPYDFVALQVDSTSPVPEPGTLTLLGLGSGILLFRRLRHRQ